MSKSHGGAYYTPASYFDRNDRGASIVDPAAGTGAFLPAAVKRIVAKTKVKARPDDLNPPFEA